MRVPVPLDLAATLHGGQAFRWRRDDQGAWRGAIGDHAVLFREQGGVVTAEGAPDPVLRSYLRIEPADVAKRARLAKDPVLAPTLAAHPGLRLLRQDPWETTVAFLTSANNNVLRIEGIIARLCERYGDGARFPEAAAIARARESTLRACGLGYRAPFLRGTARAVAGGLDLMALRGRPLAEIREALLPLPGVGPKVADCIALFSLDADEAFPIDRWVLRAMHDAFGTGDKPRDVEAFAHARWGDAAGLAQQFLFHAVRVREQAPGTGRLLSKRPSA